MTRFDRARSGAFSPMTRDLILMRDRWRCIICGGQQGLTVHHRRPRAMGGTRDRAASLPSNGITLCMGAGTRDCHGLVERHRRAARGFGYLVQQGQDPAVVPVRHRLFGLVLLDADGGFSEASA